MAYSAVADADAATVEVEEDIDGVPEALEDSNVQVEAADASQVSTPCSSYRSEAPGACRARRDLETVAAEEAEVRGGEEGVRRG